MLQAKFKGFSIYFAEKGVGGVIVDSEGGFLGVARNVFCRLRWR